MTEHQLTLDDARAQRDEGIERVERRAPASWLDYAFEFVTAYLVEHETLFVDDLWTAGLAEPPSMRALGPIMQRAARDGLMVKTGQWRPSVRSNLSEKPVWRSLIFGSRAALEDLLSNRGPVDK